MAGIFLRHDQDVPQAHLVDSIHPMGAQGVEGDAMTAILLLALALVVVFLMAACAVGTGDGE